LLKKSSRNPEKMKTLKFHHKLNYCQETTLWSNLDIAIWSLTPLSVPRSDDQIIKARNKEKNNSVFLLLFIVANIFIKLVSSNCFVIQEQFLNIKSILKSWIFYTYFEKNMVKYYFFCSKKNLKSFFPLHEIGKCLHPFIVIDLLAVSQLKLSWIPSDRTNVSHSEENLFLVL